MRILTVTHEKYDYEWFGFVLKCNYKDKKDFFTADSKFSIYPYSHCSCHGTDECMKDKKFYGSFNEFYPFIKNKMRFDLPDKKLCKSDCDYLKVAKLYEAILEWKEARFPKWNNKRYNV